MRQADIYRKGILAGTLTEDSGEYEDEEYDDENEDAEKASQTDTEQTLFI